MQMPRVQYDLIRLQGGLDQVTPTLSLAPGVARRAANFECSITGGYTRIAGYERFDGRAKPSDAKYNLLACTLTAEVAVGTVIMGAASGASGVVIGVDVGYLIITREIGALLAGEGIVANSQPVGQIDQVLGVASDGLKDATYLAMAADYYRNFIGPVPGSGPVRGVAMFAGALFAWRDNAAGNALVMYRSSTSGWTQVSLGYELGFNGGLLEIRDGVTVVGATSGATGVVGRVAYETGDWAAHTAEGRLILNSRTGVFAAGENLKVDGVVCAVCTSPAQQITLQPGGRVESVVANFGGGVASYRLYGCDSKNRAFEFDGTTYAPIRTGMAVDAPEHIAFHKQHLFLTFGASLQFSGLGFPHQWTPLMGAGELAMNGPITNLLQLPGDQSSGALAVYTRSDTSVLYGTSSVDFKLVAFNTGTGAFAYTAQNIDQAYVLDDRGIMSLGTSLNFGNFVPASLTMTLRPYILLRRQLATASTVNREKGQYRIFFSDANALYMTVLNGRVLGTMPIQFLNPVLVCTEGENAQGDALSFFGSDNGYVYQMDAGTSFDGLGIPANLSLVYNSVKSPRILKRFRKASVELTGDSYAQIGFGYDLAYRTTALSQSGDLGYESDLRSSFWDSMTWDNFVWDGSEVSPTEVELEGTGENMAIRISSVSAIIKPFTVNNIIVHYSMRRGLR